MRREPVSPVLQTRPDPDLTMRETGDGEPVLVLHGGAGPASVAAIVDHLAADPLADESASTASCLFDLDGVAHGAYGLQRTPALVLVRPDGHITFRSSARSADQLAAFCAAVTRTAA